MCGRNHVLQRTLQSFLVFLPPMHFTSLMAKSPTTTGMTFPMIFFPSEDCQLVLQIHIFKLSSFLFQSSSHFLPKHSSVER